MSTDPTLSAGWPAAVARARRTRRIRLIVTLIASVLAAIVLVAVFLPRLLPGPPPPPPSAHGNRTPTGASLPSEPVLSDVPITGIRSGRDPGEDDTATLISGGLVIVADDADETRFSAVSLETGEIVWQAVLADGLAREYPGDTPHWFEFLTTPETEVVVVRVVGTTFTSPEVLAGFSADDGSLRWSVPLGDDGLDDARYDVQLTRHGDVLLSARIEGTSGIGGRMRLLDHGTGEIVWEAETDAGWPVDMQGERIFVHSSNSVEVLDLADGSPIKDWSEECLSAPKSGEGLPVAPTAIGSVFVASRTTDTHICDGQGRSIWTSSRASAWPVGDDWGQDANAPTATSELFVSDHLGQDLRDASSGTRGIELHASLPVRGEGVVRSGDLLGLRSREGYAVVDAVSGEERWHLRIDEEVHTDVLWTPNEVVLSDGASVSAHEPDTGDELWSVPLPLQANGTPAQFVVLGTRVFLGIDGAYRQLVPGAAR
ncbi:PQQ-binding-like beta-propeller repeat protein [Microbacterium sp. ZW T5_45]|uniref:outer membrane protein assembly factor BamB family protein n=1 Tax=Microbacterium sp. ZW T5_45 TaxID=3378080 RepID=UPI003852E28E